MLFVRRCLHRSFRGEENGLLNRRAHLILHLVTHKCLHFILHIITNTIEVREEIQRLVDRGGLRIVRWLGIEDDEELNN
jgi:hypothetical protein